MVTNHSPQANQTISSPQRSINVQLKPALERLLPTNHSNNARRGAWSTDSPVSVMEPAVEPSVPSKPGRNRNRNRRSLALPSADLRSQDLSRRLQHLHVDNQKL
ncbi:hypothetical protein ACOSP7_021594 [Xanthoceras sorbifolium]